MKFVRIVVLLLPLVFVISTSATTISSFNVRNFNVDGPYPTTSATLEEVLTSNSSDIFAFQEIVDIKSFNTIIARVLPEHRSISSKCGGYGKQKLVFVYNSKKFKVIESIEDLNISGRGDCDSGVRPLLKVKVRNIKSSQTMWAILVHLKAGGKPSDIEYRKNQIHYIQKAISNLEHYFILGDFNTTQFYNESGQYFKEFISRNELATSSSAIECSSYWWGGISDGLYYPSLLDHILLSPKLVEKFQKIDFTNNEHCSVNSCRISNSFELGDSFNNVSDHCPVSAKLIRK